ERVLLASLESPRVVLARAEIDLVELVRALAAEERILEASGAVLLAEEEAEGVLGISVASAESAADAQTGIDAEAFLAVGVDQLRGHRPFPGAPVVSGIHVDAGRRAEEIGDVGRDDDRRNREESGLDLRRPDGVVHDVGIHAVVEHLTVDASRRPARPGRLATGRLPDDVAQEKIAD